MTGHDALYLPIQVGTKPFDLIWEVKVDRNQGHSLFNPGICVGLTTGMPGRMHEEDVTFSISTQYAGLYPGILRGEPYYRQPNYSNMANFSHTNLTRGGEVPVIKYDHHIKSFIGLDRSLFQSIRRDGLGNLTFKAWLPSLGQTEHNPWWTRSLVLEEHGEKELKCLMIKRIPLLASHLGGWGVGYDVFETTGRIPYLAMRPNPPKVTSIEWEDTVLKSGDTVTLKGTGLEGNPIVRIGDLEVQKTRSESNQEMTFQLPKIKSGKTYDLLVRNAGQSEDWIPNAIPVGKVINSIHPATFSIKGGDLLTIKGSGFSERTQFRVGGKAAEVVELNRLSVVVKTPKLPVGSHHLSAQTFSGKLTTASRARPSLYLGQKEMEVLRKRLHEPQFSSYLECAIPPATDSKRRDHDMGQRPPMSGHFVNSAPYNLFWRYVAEGKDEYATRLLEWAEFFADTGILDDIHFRQAGISALAYDVLGDSMTPELRDKVEGFLRKGITWYLKADKEHEWFPSITSYTNPQTGCYALEVAFALDHQDPRVEEVVSAVKRHLLKFMDDGWHPDGGGAEGLSRNFTSLIFYLRAGVLLERHREDTTLFKHPNLKNVHRQLETLMAGDSHYFPFRNSHHELNDVTSTALLYKITGNPFYLWATDAAVKQGVQKANAIRGLLFRPDGPTPPAPKLPTLSALQSVGWAALRSDTKPDAALVVGVKGADGPIPWHFHRDGGSFVVYQSGTPVFIDPGWSPSSAQDHSIPIINGVQPDKRGTLLVDTWENKDWRLAVVDSSRAYSGIEKVRRHILMFRDSHVFVLDDISEHGASVQTRLQTPPKNSGLTLSAKGFSLQVDEVNAAVKFSGVTNLETTQEKRRSSIPVVAKYTTNPDKPLLTIITLNGKPAAIHQDPKRIAIKLEGQSALFEQTSKGWAFVPKGGKPLYSDLPNETREVLCIKAKKAPKVDGNLNDKIWKSAPSGPDFIDLPGWRGESVAPKHGTKVQYAWDEQYLYAAITCQEPNPESLVVTKVSPAQFVEDDDHLRLGFLNLPGGASTYATFNANGLGAWEDIQVATSRQKSSWTAEIAIPYSRLNNLPIPKHGDTIHISATRFRSQMPSEHSGLGLEQENLVFKE